MSTTLMELFHSGNLDTTEGKNKIAAAGGDYIRDKLREKSFARKILPPRRVTKADLQVSPNHDEMVFVDEVEPESQAVVITFRGDARPRYIEGKRYEIPFFTVSSERFEKREQELLAYRMPLTKIIEDNSVLDIQEQEDYRFLVYLEQAAAVNGNTIRGEQATDDATANGLGNGLRGKVQRQDLIDLENTLDGSRRTIDKYLFAKTDWNDIKRWTIEDNGDGKQGEIMVSGYKYREVNGIKAVVTVKQDILQAGNIYGFCAPEWLGKFLVLNSTKFYIDKKINLIWWVAWEDIGMSISNIASFAKLELYNGQGAADNSSDSLLGASNVGGGIYNEVADGNVFPSISRF